MMRIVIMRTIMTTVTLSMDDDNGDDVDDYIEDGNKMISFFQINQPGNSFFSFKRFSFSILFKLIPFFSLFRCAVASL